MLKLPSQENEWHEVLPGIRVLFRPIGRKAWRAAQKAAAGVMRDGGELQERDELLEDVGDELSYALLYRGIVDWEGVVGDDDQPVAPTPDVPRLVDGKPASGSDGELLVDRGTISAFLSDPIVFRACDRAYVMPFITRQREKNGSSASPDGTGEAETQAAATASSRAAGAKGPVAKNVRTRSRSRRAKPAP